METVGSYVWGLDGSPGTYITDYVLGGLCSVYGICILSLYKTTDPLPSRLDGRKDKEVSSASGNYIYMKKGPKRLLLVLSVTFIICGFMNAIGALIHHLVPLVEPDALEVANDAQVRLDFSGRMRLQLYPWYLVWQIANTSAFLYGIFTFLSAIYTIEFDVFLRDAIALSGIAEDAIDGCKVVGEKTNSFHTIKKRILYLISGMFLLHFAYRFWRIFEYRRDIFSGVFQDEDENEMDFHEAKMNLEKFGAIWSATAASVVMMLAFLLNAWIATYLMFKRGSRKVISDFKCHLARAVGAWMLSLGGFVQLFYASACGKNFATECPFHTAFNHNAWYHVLQGIGMTLWFFAEWTFFKKVTCKFLEGKQS